MTYIRWSRGYWPSAASRRGRTPSASSIPTTPGTSFIGVGAQPPTPSLWQIIAERQNYWSQDLWVVAIPSAVLVLIVLGLNALGDGLRDLVDPRLRTRG